MFEGQFADDFAQRVDPEEYVDFLASVLAVKENELVEQIALKELVVVHNST